MYEPQSLFPVPVCNYGPVRSLHVRMLYNGTDYRGSNIIYSTKKVKENVFEGL